MDKQNALRLADPGTQSVIVAIDGPAGSGKSSVAKAAAAQLGYGTLDTGAGYRALTLYAANSGIDLTAEDDVLGALAECDIELPLLAGDPVRLNGDDVSAQIRDPQITAQIAKITAHGRVRAALNEFFRARIAASGLAGVVIEGRDITTVVAPDAPVRVILTASQQERARRRQGELPGHSFERVLQDLAARDKKDLEVVDFINPAAGVELIDTTELSFAQAVAAVVELVKQRIAA